MRRLEVECAISALDAEALLSLRQSGLVEKVRFTVPWRGHVWEVDAFCGNNAGLVVGRIREHLDRVVRGTVEETLDDLVALRGGHVYRQDAAQL